MEFFFKKLNYILAVSFISNIFLFIQITYYQKQQIESLEKFKELETLKDQIDQMVKKLNEMELKSNLVTEEPLIKTQIFSSEGLDIFFNNINFLELYSPVTNTGIFNIIISCCVLFSLGYSLYNVKYIASALITMPESFQNFFSSTKCVEMLDTSGNLFVVHFSDNLQSCRYSMKFVNSPGWVGIKDFSSLNPNLIGLDNPAVFYALSNPISREAIITALTLQNGVV